MIARQKFQIQNAHDCLFRVAALLVTLCVAAPLRASLVEVAVGLVQNYSQVSTAAPTSASSFGIYFFYDQNPGDFTSATLSYPGAGTPLTLPTSGTQPTSATQSFSTLSALQTAYPFGPYTFTLSNGSTVAFETDTYSQNLFPAVIPAFASASSTAVQGMNSVNAMTLNFNNFTPNPLISSPGAFTEVTIVTTSGVPVFDSGQLPDSATSVVIPAGTLQPDTTYTLDLRFNNNFVTVDTTTNVHLANGFNDVTRLQFTTANALTNFSGGTSSQPVALVGSQPIGQVSATIAGQGAEDYYLFNWGGGDFSATASVSNTSVGSYSFTAGLVGGCDNLGSATLDNTDSFTSTLSIPSLAPGQYCVGIDANNPADPPFTLTFNTPVDAVPEPSTFMLLSIGSGLVSGWRLARRRRRD